MEYQLSVTILTDEPINPEVLKWCITDIPALYSQRTKFSEPRWTLRDMRLELNPMRPLPIEPDYLLPVLSFQKERAKKNEPIKAIKIHRKRRRSK